MQLADPRVTKGWLLDVYPSDFGKVAVWVISESGDRVKLTDKFQPCIYVSGRQDELETLISRLYNNEKIVSVRFVQKYVQATDAEKSPVLEVTVKDCRQIRALTLEILRLGDYLRYELYNCDIQDDRSYLFSRRLFPLAYLEVKYGKSGLEYKLLDSVESINYTVPPLRVARLELEVAKTGIVAGFDDEVRSLTLRQDGEDDIMIDYGDEATKLMQLVYAVKKLDPDVILTQSGDSFLFPYLIHRAAENAMLDEFVLSRDNTPFSRKTGTGQTFFSYGHTFYRASAIRLYGRIHVDEHNTFIMRESKFDGFIEIARTCRVPLHTAARFSIGSSMSSIQYYQALQDDILLPRNKKNTEAFKSALDLLVGDRGGLVFEPRLGLHDSIGELDFSSMYPSLMAKYNISAETVLCKCCPDSPIRIPDLNYHICQKRVGMVPKTVQLALTKRLSYKRLRDETSDPELKQMYDMRQTALKWILVTCFGYLGFKNSKFGSVDGHIGVCAYAREAFLKATHLAEDAGFEVIHGIVDSLWVKKENTTMDEYRQLCKAITDEVGVPMNFEGRYRWIVFLPSTLHPRVSVLNRYYGVMDNGKVKVRGLEVRRRDTPRFIYDLQMDMIAALASARNSAEFNQKIPDAIGVVNAYRQKLLDGDVPVWDLIVTKHMSKAPQNYRQHVSQVIVAEQLTKKGVEVHAGGNLSFVFTDAENKRYSRRVVAEQLIDKGVHADTKKYLLMLYSSAANLLSFKGYTPKTIRAAVNGESNQSLTKYLRE